MKLLRVRVEGLPLFKEELDIMFYSKQRIQDDSKENMHLLFSNIYLNCSNAFIGKNASGKTSVLHVILLALNILNNEPINHIKSKYILGDADRVVFHIYFYSKENGICYLSTNITSKRSNDGQIVYEILNEKLWIKKLDKIKSRKYLTDFSNMNAVQVRSNSEEYLPDDVSMIIAFNKRNHEHITVSSLLSFTNTNTISLIDEIPKSIITFLDPTIEYICVERINNKSLIHLKFKGKEEIFLNNPSELEFYLSSGTIKGINTFIHVRNVLKDGGYLLVDEIENHFNTEIVSTLVRFFMDTKLNKNGAVLIYTTHYPEILDEYNRNDSIYITENKNGLLVNNLSDLLSRNDIKKSDAYQSGMMGETSPEYESYMNLKKYLKNYIQG